MSGGGGVDILLIDEELTGLIRRLSFKESLISIVPCMEYVTSNINGEGNSDVPCLCFSQIRRSRE